MAFARRTAILSSADKIALGISLKWVSLNTASQYLVMILLTIFLAADWMAVVSRMPELKTISPGKSGTAGSGVTTSLTVLQQ
jgi:hypothetical protein